MSHFRLAVAVCVMCSACVASSGSIPVTQANAVQIPVAYGVAESSLGDRLSEPEPISATEYAARRDTLAARISDGIMVVLGSFEDPDAYITFVQNPSFLYLTGFREPNAALIMVKRNGVVTNTLFVEPRDPLRETWEGIRMGPDGVTRDLKVRGRTVAEFSGVLDSLLGDDSVRVYVVGNFDPRHTMLTREDQILRTIASKHSKAAFVPANRLIEKMRERKSPAELALLEHAIDITVDAHRAALPVIVPGRAEYEVEAMIEYTFHANGAERPAFATIVGSGPNSTILHYASNHRVMRDGDMVVMDIGASYRGYAADVTRTVPVNGRFTPEQRAIYQAVRDAQTAAEKAAVVGAPANAMSKAAIEVLERELTAIGLIEKPGAEFVCEQKGQRTSCPQYALYYMHGLGHAIGLNVHDFGSSGVQDGILAAGDIFSIEPGIYIRANTLDLIEDVPENRALRQKIRTVIGQYKNIGVRIEDDYIMTDRGLRWISRAPREIDELEAAMGSARR